MSEDSDVLSKAKDLMSSGRFVVAGHLGPQDRPFAPVDDPRDFSWCAHHLPSECGGHWNWDKRMMFSTARLGGPAFEGKVIQSFVCYNHYMHNEYGLAAMQDKLGHTCYVPPHVEHHDDRMWRIVGRLFPLAIARRIAGFLDRGVRIRAGGWEHAPFTRARVRALRRFESAWELCFHGFTHFEFQPTECHVCGRTDDHAHSGWITGYRFRRQ